MGPEAKIQSKVVAYAKERGCVAIKLSMLGRYGTRGWPDSLFLGPLQRIFFIEFKAEGADCTPLQLERHRQLRALGFSVYVCDDVGAGKRVVDDELAKGPSKPLVMRAR